MPSNKRKVIGNKVRGNYPRQKLIDAVFAVLKGRLTVADAHTEFKVPSRTIRRWVKRGREALKKLLPEEAQVFHMPDFNGPARGLCREDEISIKAFIEDAADIGIPRTQSRCAEDIQTFVRHENLVVPFKDDKPGSSYFERFCSDVDGWPVTFKTAQEVNDFMFRDIDLDQWILQVNQYVTDNLGELIKDKRLIFVIECQRFKTVTNPSRDLSVIMIYNGSGDVVQWIVVTDGTQLSDDFVIRHCKDLLVLKTDDGGINGITVKSALIVLNRHLKKLPVEGCPFVYMDQFIAQEVNYVVWKYTQKEGLHLMAIPRRLCYALRTLKMGGMAKFATKMLFFMHHRFVNVGSEMNEMNFIHVTLQIMAMNFQRHLTTSVNFMRLTSVVCRQPVMHIEDDTQCEETTAVQPGSGDCSGRKGGGGIKRKRRKIAGKKAISVQQECSTDTSDLVRGNDKSTQTIEIGFVRDSIQHMIQYLVNTIRVEDFED